MLDGRCSEMGLASHHVQRTLNITQCWTGVWLFEGTSCWVGETEVHKSHGSVGTRKQGRARPGKSNLGN